MIERTDLDDNALEISSTAHTIRVLVHGDKTYFSAVDILKACGIKAPTKWMERNTSDRPDIVTSKLEYPVKTTQGYRRVKLNFVTGGVGKRLVKYTTCPEETKKWLLEEVLTYRATKAGRASQEDESIAEKKKAPAQKKEDISRRIDSILLELLEIKRSLAAGASSL